MKVMVWYDAPPIRVTSSKNREIMTPKTALLYCADMTRSHMERDAEFLKRQENRFLVKLPFFLGNYISCLINTLRKQNKQTNEKKRNHNL